MMLSEQLTKPIVKAIRQLAIVLNNQDTPLDQNQLRDGLSAACDAFCAINEDLNNDNQSEILGNIIDTSLTNDFNLFKEVLGQIVSLLASVDFEDSLFQEGFNDDAIALLKKELFIIATDFGTLLSYLFDGNRIDARFFKFKIEDLTYTTCNTSQYLIEHISRETIIKRADSAFMVLSGILLKCASATSGAPIISKVVFDIFGSQLVKLGSKNAAPAKRDTKYELIQRFEDQQKESDEYQSEDTFDNVQDELMAMKQQLGLDNSAPGPHSTVHQEIQEISQDEEVISMLDQLSSLQSSQNQERSESTTSLSNQLNSLSEEFGEEQQNKRRISS